MHNVQQNIALAFPDQSECKTTFDCVGMVRAAQLNVRIILGVGESRGRIPLRVLGHAKMIADALQHDVNVILKRPRTSVQIFCSATKLAHLSGISDITSSAQGAVPPMVALAESLKLSGFTGPISIDVAAPYCEIPEYIYKQIALPSWLQSILDRYKGNNRSEADSRCYGIEHAAMFEDIGSIGPQPLRIFIGGKAEGIFWVIRRKVRLAAASYGQPVNPMIGIVLYGIKHPWYHSISEEPTFADLLSQPLQQIQETLTNLAKICFPLKREITHTQKLLCDERVLALAVATASLTGSIALAKEHNFQFNERIQNYIK